MIEIIPKEDVKVCIVEHHEKYKEIHGEDKTTFMPILEHIELHKKLRKEGKCNISRALLDKISQDAYRRTEKYVKEHEITKIKRKNINQKGAKEGVLYRNKPCKNCGGQLMAIYNKLGERMLTYCIKCGRKRNLN